MNLGMPEMLFIFLLALIVFGPKKLPELARQLGKIMADFKRATNDFKYQLENEIEQMDIKEQNQQREKSRAQQIVDGELTILPPPLPGVPTGVLNAPTLPGVPTAFSTPSEPPVEATTAHEPEQVPEQLSFTDEQPGAPEPTHDLQREPNV